MTTATTLAHRIDGVDDTILLLNGGFMTIASWDAIAAPLTERYRVLRCDFRGQLLSAGPPPDELASHVEDVVALLDSLEIEKVHAVGTSFGAEVGLLLAAVHPSRVASLVAAAATDVATPALAERGGRLQRELERAAGGGDRAPLLEFLHGLLYSPAYVAAHRRELAAAAGQAALLPDTWFDSAARILASLQRLDLTDRLGEIACPVLVLAAEGDRIMPLERARALASAIRDARLEVVADCGHALVVEQPERLVRSCMDFLRSVRRYG